MNTICAALDQGTTSTRCIIFSADGRILGQDQREHQSRCPQPGWVEHDPLEIMAHTWAVLDTALARAGLGPADLAGLGITNQRETIVVWEKATGRPCDPALVWQDTRTADFCTILDRDHGQVLRDLTGLPAATYFSASKLRWILDHVEGLRVRAARGEILAGTMDTWLLWNLSGGPDGGVHATDVTNASRTQLMNLETLDWDPVLLEIFSIPREILPRIAPSVSHFGQARLGSRGGTAAGGSKTGAGTGAHGTYAGGGHDLPVLAMFGDQHAALFGQACFAPGEAKNTYGTGCFLLLNTGLVRPRSKNGLLETLAYQIEGSPAVYALEGSVAVAGSLVQWLRDKLGIIGSSAEIEHLAASVEDNGGVCIVPAFSGLFAPWWRSDARGAILGLTAYAGKGHLARAALESTAFQTCDVIEAMERDTGLRLKELKVDGGMTVNRILMQFQADMVGAPVIRPRVVETTALGAALGAGLGAGVHRDLDSIRSMWARDQVWEAAMAPAKRQLLLDQWHKAVKRSFDWPATPGTSEGQATGQDGALGSAGSEQ